MRSEETVEIFKTNIADPHHAIIVVRNLTTEFPDATFNVDLYDADKILRMQGPSHLKNNVMTFVKKLGFECAEMT
jgi:hypothetical protein